ncbi:CLUMA_CG005159, isoform A [Clunio marinus]|uniref:CLUMA_CG005159, isoform A n=1 Tax=Clunio marinus TaxID=568069 RepID=A0A1J1HU16_9DIPT|nr:CLUMA_CG005159, isoform A [Clunio marinus]
MRSQGILFIVGVLNISLITAQSNKSAKNCCDNDSNLMLMNNTCSPGINGKKLSISLECDEKYILDSMLEEDAYNVTEDGLYVHDLKSTIPLDEFCLVNQQDEEFEDVHEIAIICFPERPVVLSFIIKGILLFISVVFLILTIRIYFRLPELRETQDKATIIMLINLTAFLFFLGVLQLQAYILPSIFEGDLCTFLALLIYFFTMSYFAWLNCVIANVWKAVVLRHLKLREFTWYLFNHIYGWAVPLMLTEIVRMHHYGEPHEESRIISDSCWFDNNREDVNGLKPSWTYVYLPISIMLGFNVFLCIWTSLCLTKIDISPDARKALRYKCILYLKLFLLGGLTWFLEVLSYMFKDHIPTESLWIIVDAFNCLHGVFAFCILIIWRQRIRKELAGKTVCCYKCPTKWADVENDEQICLENEGKGKYDLIIKTLK